MRKRPLRKQRAFRLSKNPKPPLRGAPQGGLSCPSGNSPSGGPPERKRGNSGSEEECGRLSESQHNISDILSGWMQDRTMVKVLTCSKQEHCRPHSSSVTNRFRRADWRQLPPGGSDGCCRTIATIFAFPVIGPGRRGQCRPPYIFV